MADYKERSKKKGFFPMRYLPHKFAMQEYDFYNILYYVQI